jgi:hypothetical protein
MTEKEKPFVYTKSGLGFTISPRNAAGWRAFAVWMAAYSGATGVFFWANIVANGAGWSDSKILLLLALPYLFVTAVWSFAMIRYMKARSEIVDVDSLMQLKRELDRNKKRKLR